MDEELTSLRSSLSSLQNIHRLLVEEQCVDSNELLSMTETLPEIVRRHSISGYNKDATLLTNISSSLSAILTTKCLPSTRVHALQCLLHCSGYSNEIVSVDKTKKRATEFAKEHLGHSSEYTRYCCTTWLSNCPTLSKPGPGGERFCLSWREMMSYALSSLQGCVTSLSPEPLTDLLTVEYTPHVSYIENASHTARRVTSLFNLILSLLSHSSPSLVPIPMEAILHILTLTITHLYTDQYSEIQCSAWRFLDKLAGVVPSCLIPFTQSISVLFSRSINTHVKLSVSVCMLQSMSSWLEVSQTGVLPLHLHQFLDFLKTHSSLRPADNSHVPSLPLHKRSSQKRGRDRTAGVEYTTDTDSLLLANQCLSTAASLVRNSITEVSVVEYDSFMNYLVGLTSDSSTLKDTFPPDPLVLRHTSLLYSLLSDLIFYTHPMTSSHIPTLIPYFTQGLYSDHIPTRQVCRTAISMIESTLHPTLPPIKHPTPVSVPVSVANLTTDIILHTESPHQSSDRIIQAVSSPDECILSQTSPTVSENTVKLVSFPPDTRNQSQLSPPHVTGRTAQIVSSLPNTCLQPQSSPRSLEINVQEISARSHNPTVYSESNGPDMTQDNVASYSIPSQSLLSPISESIDNIEIERTGYLVGVPISPTVSSPREMVICSPTDIERPTKLARLDTTEEKFDDFKNQELSTILGTFVEAEPDSVM